MDQLNGYTARPLRAAMQRNSWHPSSQQATLPQLQAALLSSLAKSMQPCAGKYHHIYSLSDLMSLSTSPVAGLRAEPVTTSSAFDRQTFTQIQLIS